MLKKFLRGVKTAMKFQAMLKILFTLLKKRKVSAAELAAACGVSERSVTRKAREMGLEKDKGFVASLSREHLLLANARSKELGYPGGFTKGMKFRGNQYTGRIRVE